jgi:amino acid adenylation domain-containing protein
VPEPQTPTTDEDVFAFPASFAEQRLWFLDQVDPFTAVYNVPLGLRLEGALDVTLLERSLQQIVQRHESLRTTFAGQDGIPLQIVTPSSKLAFKVVDLRDLPESEREDEALRLANAEAQTPFDLRKGPLFRVVAIVLGVESHIVVLNAHHIVCDGSSLGLVLEELSALYPALLAGSPSPLAPVTTQYADFALWQSEWLSGAELERSLSFWKSVLAGTLSVLDLPSDRPRPQFQTFQGGGLRFPVSAELTAKLGALARQEGVTLFMLTLAAFNVLLHRLSGQSEILVGTPMVNRERAEIEKSIGFYTNTVVFRTDLSGAAAAEPLTFKGLLGRVRKMTVDVLAHQDIPFEKVVEAVHPARATSHNPLFQAMFGLQTAPQSALRLPGVRAMPIAVYGGTSKFDLTLDMQEVGGAMEGLLEYSADLFERDTAERLARQFVTLLEGIVANPTAEIGTLPMLTADERRTILVGWNATAAPYLAERRIHDLVAAQASSSPDAVAVELEGETLTYASLEGRATHLASYLQELGARRGAIVAICMDRSLDMVVALLAVLKSGAAYLPLDPSYPRDRLAYMLEDAKASIILTQADLRDGLPVPEVGAAPKLLAVDADWDEIGRPAHGSVALRSLSPEGSPDDRAYVIYTSGSTGKPKGVEVPHRAVVNFLTSMAREPGLSSGDRLLAVTTLSFDIAGLELFLPLIVGATVVLASRDVATDGGLLLDALLGARITAMQATPATYRMLVEAGWAPSVRPLRLLCGGEALPPSLAEALLERATELWNMYGPTETTIWSTCTRIRDAEAISIGRPIANTQVYVLDPTLEPVPIGVTGELYIAGDGVARGYLGRPELTDERFIADPFSPNRRMYRTGDQARFDADGALHFVGRRDSQVKVRGFRIELGEIEAALSLHPELRQVVVTVRSDATGDARIVAYVVVQPNASPTPTELRKHLRRTLPDHMIPHLFVELAAVPLTHNGKVDRRVLPDPFMAERRVVVEASNTAPTTDTEKVIAEIWRERLKVDTVTIHDNFFDLGGHSLLSMQVIHRVAARTGHRLNPRSMVFNNLQQIAAECERGSEV